MKFIPVLLAGVLLLPLSCKREPPMSGTTTVADTGTTIAVTETTTTIPLDTAAGLDTAAMREPVVVTLVEYRINMPATLPAGLTSFQVSNSGRQKHNFEIEGNGIEKKLDRDLSPGEVVTLQVELPAGTYRVYCPVGDHVEKHGMSRQLTVR